MAEMPLIEKKDYVLLNGLESFDFSTIGATMDSNLLIHSDNLMVLKALPSESIDLVYLDPPFFTGAIQSLRDRVAGTRVSYSDIWDDEENYLLWIKPRLMEVYRVLKNTGTAYLHCDWHASHHLRKLMDDIFGKSRFLSEIIWSYRRWTNSLRSYQRSHETILFYSKSPDYVFNVMYEDYSFTTNIDQIWQKRARDEKGKVVTPKQNEGYIPLAKDKLGVPMRDVWEIPYLNPKAKERTGYPTQKPVELLERIMLASSNENAIALDPFAGSGTTLIAARKHRRRWIGIDNSEDAIRIIQTRLNDKSNLANATVHYSPYRLAQFLKLSRTDKIEHLARVLEMNVAQRNPSIDGFLKKGGKWKFVAIKYIENEDRNQALKAFWDASLKRGVALGIAVFPRLSHSEKAEMETGYQGRMRIMAVSYEDIIARGVVTKMLSNDVFL